MISRLAALLLTAMCAMTCAGPARAKPFDSPLGVAPLDTPLVVNGGFGEYRVGHFHAGFDLGTHRQVGKPVHAPLAGYIERVRASGVGYGRSVYLRGRDGRLLQFGHLDAFAEPVASWVDSIQRATGQYEQDLWPEAWLFPVKVGQRVAWTGESGAGGPHLHFEIRRGDVAYHPARAGLMVADKKRPTLATLTLEPLDEASRVGRRVGPLTVKLTAAPETLSALGRLRAIVGARDGTWSGVDRMVPWLTRVDWGAEWVEWQMDSVSWATDMSESDYAYDAGRVVGDKGLVMWAPAGWRPRMLRTSVPLAREAGTLEVRAGDPPRVLKITARDAAGNSRTREVVIRPLAAAPAAGRPVTIDALLNACECDCFLIGSLPSRALRITQHGDPKDGANPRVGLLVDGIAHGFDGDRPGSRAAIVTVPKDAREIVPVAAFSSAAGCSTYRGRPLQPIAPGAAGLARRDLSPGEVVNELRAKRWTWEVPPDAIFDGSLLLASDPYESARPKVDGELIAVQHLGGILPATVPLRRAIRLQVSRPETSLGHLGVYRYGSDGWEWVRTTDRPDGLGWDAEISRPGWLAVLADTLPPRASLPKVRAGAAEPYSRWSLEASLVENGSGVDSRGSYFLIDGERVPVEWDPEASILRWRPRRAPVLGTHQVTVLATDRAGNQRVISGSFVRE